MKVGDFVRYKKDGPTLARHVRNVGIIVEIDDSHRQTVCTLLMDNGRIVGHVWDQSIEVMNDYDAV